MGNVASGDDNWGPAEGGACGCTLYNCALSGNIVHCFSTDSGFPGFAGGGGAYGSTLYNCTLSTNWAESTYGVLLLRAGDGGGACSATLYNCTLTGNRAGGVGGGASADWIGGPSTLCNCIAYSNMAAVVGANYYSALHYESTTTLNYCCTTPMPTNGVGNITNAPLFVEYAGGNLHLQSNSPCINAGNNSFVIGTTDLDGNPRIVNGTVDMGAYEYQGAGSVISYAWLQQYRLPTDGLADFADPDGDHMNNWQEWRCGTDPTNSLSVLQMLSVSNAVSGVKMSWQSVAGVN